jgi:hypothetical protein
MFCNSEHNTLQNCKLSKTSSCLVKARLSKNCAPFETEKLSFRMEGSTAFAKLRIFQKPSRKEVFVQTLLFLKPKIGLL